MGKYKGVSFAVSQPLQLYNLDVDVGETTDIASQYPEIVKQMEAVKAREHKDNPYFPIENCRSSWRRERERERGELRYGMQQEKEKQKLMSYFGPGLFFFCPWVLSSKSGYLVFGARVNLVVIDNVHKVLCSKNT